MRGLVIILLLAVIASIAITHIAPEYSPFPSSLKRMLDIEPSFKGISRIEASAGPPPVVDPDDPLHGEFEQTYRAKLSNPAYLEWKSRAGLPSDPQDFPEERRIKAIRAQIAARITAPDGAEVIRIPVNRQSDIAPDGRFTDGEWTGAIAVPVGINGAQTTLFLLSDGERLFLGCDVPDDETQAGFDQLRFYLHLGITPKLVNERLHVGDGGRHRAIRQTDIRYHGPRQEGDRYRWQKYAISDWNVYRKAEAGSMVDGHRRYEAVLDLEESGLRLDVPFPARVEVETDPGRDQDRGVTSRRYLGRLGSPAAPLWLVIG